MIVCEHRKKFLGIFIRLIESTISNLNKIKTSQKINIVLKPLFNNVDDLNGANEVFVLGNHKVNSTELKSNFYS